MAQFGRNLGLIAAPMATLMPGIGQAALIIGGLAAAITAVSKIVQAIKQNNSLVDLQRQVEEDSLAAEQFTKKAEEAKNRLDELNKTPYEERTDSYEAEIEELKEVISYYEDLAQKRKEAAKEEVAQVVLQDVGTGRYKAYYQYGISGQNLELDAALKKEYASETAAIYALAKAYSVEGDSVQELKEKLVAYGFSFNEVMVSASQYQQQMVSEIASYRNLIAQSSELSDTKRQEIENYLRANKTYVDNLRLLDSLTPAQQAIISGYDRLTEALAANTSGTNGNIGSQTNWLAVAQTRQTLLLEMATATDGVTQAVYDEIAAETVFNNARLNVNDKIEALRNLATAAGVTGVLIDNALSGVIRAASATNVPFESGYDAVDIDRMLAVASSKIGSYIKPAKTSTDGSKTTTKTTTPTESATETELNGYKQSVSLAKSEAQLAEKSGKSAQEQVVANKKIQDALHSQADFLRSIVNDKAKLKEYGKTEKEVQTEINGLSAEWWDIEKKNLELTVKQTDELKDQTADLKEKITTDVDGYKNAVSLAQAEARFAKNSGQSAEERIITNKKVQTALHNQAEYIRDILKDEKKIEASGKTKEQLEAEVLALSTAWWDVENDTLAIIKEQNEETKNRLREEKSGLEDYMDTLKAAAQFAADSIQEEIDALDEANNALEEKIALEEREKALAEAKTKRKLVYKDGRFQYVEDIDAVATAQAALDETKRKQEVESRKKQLQDEKKLWTNYASDYTKTQNQLAWVTVFGTKTIAGSLDQRLKDAKTFASLYSQVADEIAGYNEIINSGSYTGAEGTSVSGITVTKPNEAAILKQMEANSLAWHTAKTQAEKDFLHEQNVQLAAQLGGLSYSEGPGTWHYASGTLSAAGGLSVVGESGPEMRVMARGDGIIPADITKNLWAWGAMTPSDLLLSLAGNSIIGGQTIAINGNLTLPNVRDAQTFLTGIKELAIQYTSKR